MKNIAIIGASYLQLPLIIRAKEMGLVTHVFAWKADDVGEKEADFFYPISIVEKDQILACCEKIGIDGIVSIASDLASITVNYVAEKMHLTGNGIESSLLSSNKHAMRECFQRNGDPSPKSVLFTPDVDLSDFSFPLIVKPSDRSGSRGITKVEKMDELASAISHAKEEGFNGEVLVEEFAEGEEFSVECISWQGTHTFLAVTKKYTTGSPSFIEQGHLEPAFPLEEEILERIKKITFHALDSLMIRYGASHTEIKIDQDGNIRLIEIGGRMGGDLIGSSLVPLSTGVDFVKAVIDVSLGQRPEICATKNQTAAIRYIFEDADLDMLMRIRQEHPEYLMEEYQTHIPKGKIADSSKREGYYVICSANRKDICAYMEERQK